MPKSGTEDLIYLLSGNDLSPEHEARIKRMKVSKAGIIMVIKEKEYFRNWREREDLKSNS